MADDQFNQGTPTEINPRPIRVIKTMGDITFSDWIWFGAFALIALPFILLNILPTFGLTGMWPLLIRTAYMSPVLIFGAMMGFIQNRTKGKFRWRFWRSIKFIFKNKVFSPVEMKQLYELKECKDNHVHYVSGTNDGVMSFYRIEGFDPTLLSSVQVQEIVQNLTNFFSGNIRFKIISARISYAIPPKYIAINSDHYGVNFAKNRYFDRINELNKNADLRQQSYFIVFDGQSIDKNTENAELITSPLSSAHLTVRPAIPEEVSQILNEVWAGTFNYANPEETSLKAISYDANIVKFSKKDGTHEYMSVLSYNSIPEIANIGWLGKIMNNDAFTVIMDCSPMSPQESSAYMEKMDVTADSLMTTNWFKKRAGDQERMRITHIKDITVAVNEAIANGNVAMKEVTFYLIFKESTRRKLKNKISEYQKAVGVFNDGWMLFDCKHMQRDAIINTRLHDIPALQYADGALKAIGMGSLSGHSAKAGQASMVNNLTITSAIDHKILTTSLGLSYPFFSKSSIADEKTWFKGFQVDQASGDSDPYFNDYWKKNEMYNSFNRFYQGRNGSGKSYTADIDFVSDRLDDKFIISIDPKPERVIMTKNLGGENLLIGANDSKASYINIFDVLQVPSTDESGNSRQNPLISQYQANLTSMSILLSLDTNNPDDKIVLSCFNDVQIYVYEKLMKITPSSDFSKIHKNKFPLMKDFYFEAIKRYKKERVPETKTAFNKLIVLMKEHAVGISSPIFNNYTNVDWSKNRLWNLIVRDIALNFGNKNILAVWTINIIRVASAFLYANQKVVLYIDEVHLIHNINGVLQRLDEFARVDRSFGGALCLINQNFNSIRGDSDPKKKEYYESIFTMSQYNFFFTTGEEDVLFLVDMLEGSGAPLSQAERSFVTRAGRGKSLIVMNAYDRYRVQFDISFWRELWEEDLEPMYLASLKPQAEENPAPQQPDLTPTKLPGHEDIKKIIEHHKAKTTPTTKKAPSKKTTKK